MDSWISRNKVVSNKEYLKNSQIKGQSIICDETLDPQGFYSLCHFGPNIPFKKNKKIKVVMNKDENIGNYRIYP